MQLLNLSSLKLSFLCEFVEFHHAGFPTAASFVLVLSLSLSLVTSHLSEWESVSALICCSFMLGLFSLCQRTHTHTHPFGFERVFVLGHLREGTNEHDETDMTDDYPAWPVRTYVHRKEGWKIYNPWKISGETKVMWFWWEFSWGCAYYKAELTWQISNIGRSL